MTRKTDFFEGSSWFKLSNLGLVLGMALKIYSSLPKGLKLRVKNNFIKKEIPAKMFFCVFRGGSRTTAASKMERFMIVTKRSILDVTTVLDPPLKFGKISKNIFWQSTSGWLFLKFIREFWEVFQNISFIEHLRNYLFHVQVAVFQPADTVKNYFTGAIQALYTRTREVAIRRRSFT